jgi:hypothetical protein
MRETELMGAIRDAVNRSGLARLWRNNVGCLQGVRYGLAVGSADLIGVSRDGRFVSIEVKTARGRASKEQVAWTDTIRRWRGISLIARTPEEALRALESYAPACPETSSESCT